MYYRKSLDEIFADMESPLTHVKGTALEAFAIQIMRLLGLRFVAWRKRAREETGQAEVDALLAGMMGGLHTRWQVQCKNTPSSRLSLEDVAKEVGIAVVTKASHVLFVANCRVTQAAMDFAYEVMRNSPLNLIILDADDFRQLRDSPAAIGEVIRAKSRAVGGLMRHGVDWHGG
ncbi:MAG: restriction endonuclease [Acidimicrobiaceae bacterium]|nr:restriction endonuclease [Acidimicrobiaceae bacterium]MDE0515851.1 restriction endonuclease [Acidimicrobiaceae bacterium]